MPLSNRIEQTAHGFKGEPARLIPSVADNALERRGVSILLSALTAVHEYRKVMLESLEHRVGQRARLEGWTEVVLVQRCRSDARLNRTADEVVNTASSWHQEQREFCLKLWPH